MRTFLFDYNASKQFIYRVPPILLQSMTQRDWFLILCVFTSNTNGGQHLVALGHKNSTAYILVQGIIVGFLRMKVTLGIFHLSVLILTSLDMKGGKI